ncbi:hypothetical protein HBB16_10800 [Pseudonocardia sp. MCCB 268]|nr:hypothetical protein [Pseudonocardia cytotoxica]
MARASRCPVGTATTHRSRATTRLATPTRRPHEPGGAVDSVCSRLFNLSNTAAR